MNTNIELSLINTTNNPGTITLPLTSLTPGRVVEFKDIVGKFNVNVLTINTSGSDRFEDGGITKVLKESYGLIQLIGSNGKWYILNGTQINTLNISTLNAGTISSINISTNLITTSSLILLDNHISTNYMNVSTSLTSTNFLYYNNCIIAGTRVGYSSKLNTYSINLFKPTFLNGLVAWFDGSDITTLFQNTAGTIPVTATGQYVNFWKDKSPLSNNAITTINIPYNNPAIVTFNSQNSNSVLTFNGSNGYDMINSSYIPNNQNYATYFYVCNSTTNVGEETVMFTNAYGVGYGRRHHIQSGGFRADLVNSYYTNDTTSFLNTYNMATVILNSFENGWINGNAFNGINNIQIFLNTPQGSASIGYLPSYPLLGNIGEIIIFNYDLPTQFRQQIEGYLAWKWGLQTKLPSNHLYRNFAP